MKLVSLFSLATGFALLGAVMFTAYSPSVQAQTTAEQDGLSALVARQQQRMDMLEEGIKDIRGTIETELQTIQKDLNSLAAESVASQSGASTDVKALQAELATMADNIGIISQRINNTLNLYSDIEFRVLRLEKRLSTLLSLSGDDIAEKIAQNEVTAAGSGPAVSMSRDANTGETVWSIEQDKLDAELSADNLTSDNSAAVEQGVATLGEGALRENQPEQQAQLPVEAEAVTDNNSVNISGAEPETNTLSILPIDESTEDQFRFALTRALQNDLETAEMAFVEFSERYPDHERSADALFWLGRVQFIQGQFEKSATTFSKFNALYSADPRLPDTTLWIAESVSKFAAPEQACDIYKNLANFLDQPPESFVTRLKELSDGANCSS